MMLLAQGLFAGNGAELGSELHLSHFKIHALYFQGGLSPLVWSQSHEDDVLAVE